MFQLYIQLGYFTVLVINAGYANKRAQNTAEAGWRAKITHYVLGRRRSL